MNKKGNDWQANVIFALGLITIIIGLVGMVLHTMALLKFINF